MPSPDELYGIKQREQRQTPTTGGFSPEDIYGEARREPGPSFGEQLLEEAPATIGGIAGGIAGAAKGAAIGAPAGPPGVAIGTVVGGGLGAFLGGAGGKGYQLAYKSATGSEDAPKDSYDAAVKMAEAGAWEAAYDIGGQLVGRGIAKGFHKLRPKAVDDIEGLSIALEKAGGKFTAAQRTDSWAVHQLDSLTRGSLTGSGVMRRADLTNAEALKIMEGTLRKNIAKDTFEALSDKEFGQLFMDTVNKGKAAHRTAVSEMYNGFDELVPAHPQTGALPVQTGPMKEKLIPVRAQLERIKYAGETPESRRLLDLMLDQDATLSFSDAQALRSNLLDAQRHLEGAVGKSKISGKVNTVVDELTKAMDKAAANQGKDVLNKYLAIKSFANKGYKTFDDKFIADMIVANKKAPERIGEYIFRQGNVTEIMKAKKALRSAAALDKEIFFDKTWSKMQAGYLESILTRSSRATEAAAGMTLEQVAREGTEISGTQLLKEFTDPKKARTLAAVFSKEQREGILEFAKVAQRVQKGSEGGLGMMMQLTQAGAIVQGVSSTLGGDPKIGASLLGLLGVPSVLGRVMTHPKGSRLMATALKTPAGSKAAGNITASLTKIIADTAEVE